MSRPVTLSLLVSIIIIILTSMVALAISPGGSIQYQGRYQHPGITIRVHNETTPLTTTDPDGNFNLNELAEGSYWLRVEAPLYLADLVEVTVKNGDATFASPIVLAGGDLNHDDKIDIVDVTLLGSYFGTTNSEADINADGQVNLLDLTIMGGNLGKVAPELPLEESIPAPTPMPTPEQEPPVINDGKQHQIYLPVVFR